VEASALQAHAAISRTRVSIGTPLLRLRSDAQLVALFRAGHDEAFQVIHDRYRQRLFAYARQMLPRRQDAEDALQDVFVRAYGGLRANDRDLALRAWLYRVAHNRCVDELRRPAPPPPEVLELVRGPIHDPIAEADKRESLRRLIADVRRLPDHQRSALLMRELGGMSYLEMSAILGVSIPAVKSLLVRARVALAQALEARDTACSDIREQLSIARDRGVRAGGTARRHMRDCPGCRQFHRDLRHCSRQLAALTPALGPMAVLAKLLGLGGGATRYAAAGGGAAAAGGAAGTGAIATGAVTGASHVATLIAAAVVTAGGAVEIQHTIAAPPPPHRHHIRAVHLSPASSAPAVVISQAPSLYSGIISAQPATADAPIRAIVSHPRQRQLSTPAPRKATPTANPQAPSSPGAASPNPPSITLLGATQTSPAGGGTAPSTPTGGSGASNGTAQPTSGSVTPSSGPGSGTPGGKGSEGTPTQPSPSGTPSSTAPGTPVASATSPSGSGPSSTSTSPGSPATGA
jgi:RNA polymerase sigma factor (sigma-70 family)